VSTTHFSSLNIFCSFILVYIFISKAAAVANRHPSDSTSAMLSLLMTAAGASQHNMTSPSLSQPALTKSSPYTAAAPTLSTFVTQATTYSSSVAGQPHISNRQSTEATHSSSSSGSNGGRRRTISGRAVAAVKMTSTGHSHHKTALTNTSILHDLHALPTTQLHHSAVTATLTSPDVIALRDTTVTSVASVTHDDFNSTASRAHDDAAASVKNHLPSSSVPSTQPHDVTVTSQTDVTSNATESVSRENFITSSSRDVDVVTSHSSISDTDTVELVSVEIKSDVDIDRSQTKPALKPDTSTRSSRPLSSRYTSGVSRLWRSVSSRLQLSTMNITTISSNTSSNTNAVELAPKQTPGDKMSSRKSSTSITVAPAHADNFNFSSGFSLTQTSTTLQSTSDSERQSATDHLTTFTGVDDVFSNSSNQSDTTRTLEHLSLSQQTTKPHQFLTGFYDQALSQSAVRESSDKTVVAKSMSSPNTRLSERWSTVRVTDRVKSSISSRLMDALTQVVSYSSPFSTSANSSSFDSMTAASTRVPITSTLSNSKSSISADSSTTAVWTRRPMSTMAASLSNVSSLSTRFAAKNNNNINVTSNSVVDFSSSPSVSASHKNAEDVTLSLQTTFAKLSTVFLSADSSRPSSVRDHTSSAAAFTQPTSHREDNDSHTSVSHFTPLLSASTSLHSSRYSTTQQQHQRSPLTLTNVHNVTYFSHHHRTASSTIVTPNLPVNISGGAYDTPRYAATLLSTETRYSTAETVSSEQVMSSVQLNVGSEAALKPVTAAVDFAAKSHSLSSSVAVTSAASATTSDTTAARSTGRSSQTVLLNTTSYSDKTITTTSSNSSSSGSFEDSAGRQRRRRHITAGRLTRRTYVDLDHRPPSARPYKHVTTSLLIQRHSFIHLLTLKHPPRLHLHSQLSLYALTAKYIYLLITSHGFVLFVACFKFSRRFCIL